MSIGDLSYYLLLGAIVGVYSTLQNISWASGQGEGAAVADGDSGSDKAVHAICDIERTTDLDARLKALARFYEQVVVAFAAGDISRFVDRMSADVCLTLAEAIAARNMPAQAPAPDTQLICLRSARVLDASVAADTVSLRIVFVGLVVSGAVEDSLHEAIDIWTFERSLERRDSQWQLVATEPAG